MNRLIILMCFVFNFYSFADDNQIINGITLKEESIQSIVEQIEPGTVLIVSEIHNNSQHHLNQLHLIEELSASKVFPISVGMEFFTYPKQNFVDLFLDGVISENDFLKNVGWGNDNWQDYKPIVLSPLISNGNTLAINLPREISNKVAKQGIDSLTVNEKSFLPPNWSLGNDLYLERFKEATGGHMPPELLINYFTAQSLWDETMSWKIIEYMRHHQNEIFVVIVGDFHAIYGGGLADKLKQRGWNNVKTISQISVLDLSEEEVKQEIEPHPIYGPRAEFIWKTK